MIIDKRKPHQHLQLRPHAQFGVGLDVEVSSDEEGFLGIWFPAKILSPPSKTHKNKYLVEYKTLVSDENESKPLTELVDPSFIRPELPALEGEEGSFHLNDVVEAYKYDGWWIGVVTEVLGERGYRVFFQNPGDDFEFQRSSLRLHMDWVDGIWVHPAVQTTDELMFSSGTSVEVKLDARGSPDIWYPGTVVKEIGKRYFTVKYRSSNNAKVLTAIVDYLHIRPSPPRCNDNTFHLLDKVDAFCNFGWSSGIITKILHGGRYIVYFKQTKKEKGLSHADLRVPMSQVNGKWFHPLQGAAVMLNAQDDSHLIDDGEIMLSPENSVVMNGNAEESRNGREERAALSGKPYVDNRTVSLVREQATVNSSTYIMPCEKSNEEVLSYVQFPPKAFGAKTTLQEELNDQSPASLEIPTSDMEDNASMGNSSSLGKMLEAQGEKTDFLINNQAPSRRQKGGRRHKRKLRSVNRTPRPSATVKGTPGKENVLNHAVNDGRVNTANEGEHEKKDLADKGTRPKRKRGKLRDSSTAQARTSVDRTKGILHIVDGNETLRRSTRPRKIVFESLMLSHIYSRKKLRVTAGILSSTQESEDRPKQKAEAVLTNKVTENPEPVSQCNSGNNSDDVRPLSSWPPWPADSHSHPLVDDTQSEERNQVSNGTLQPRISATMKSSTQERETRNHDADLGLPFTKISPVWKMVEAMEVFQQFPQNPHFQPLYETKAGCREGLAIGLMITFSGLVEKISKIHFSDPASVFNDCMETLSDLERQGFNVKSVKDRLKELMSIKSRHEQSKTISEQMRSEIEERRGQVAGIEEEINEIDNKMAELKEKRALAVSRIWIHDDELEELQCRMDSVKHKTEAIQVEFDNVINAPW